MLNSPMGPGFFIFFQQDTVEDEIGNRGQSVISKTESKIDRIKQDDEDILLLIQAIVTRKTNLRRQYEEDTD